MPAKIIPNSFQSPNDYVDVFMELLSGEEYKCLSFAARHILGWQDKINAREGVISLSMFADGYTTESGTHYGGTGINRTALVAALEALVTYRLLIKVGDPTPEGQRWLLGDDADWDGLTKRRDNRVAAVRLRTKKGRAAAEAKRAGLSDRPGEVVYGIDRGESIGQTGAGLSDRLNQNHLQNQDQNQRESAPPRANIFTLYEQVFGPISLTHVNELKAALEDYPEDWIADAFALTKKNRGRSWKYTYTILEGWRKHGRDEKPQPATKPAASEPETPPEVQAQFLKAFQTGGGPHAS